MAQMMSTAVRMTARWDSWANADSVVPPGQEHMAGPWSTEVDAGTSGTFPAAGGVGMGKGPWLSKPPHRGMSMQEPQDHLRGSHRLAPARRCGLLAFAGGVHTPPSAAFNATCPSSPMHKTIAFAAARLPPRHTATRNTAVVFRASRFSTSERILS